MEPPFSIADLDDLIEVVGWCLSGAEFPEDCEPLPDGRVPTELMRRWEPWVAEAQDMFDERGQCRYLLYAGGVRDQPAYDMQVLRAIGNTMAGMRRGG